MKDNSENQLTLADFVTKAKKGDDKAFQQIFDQLQNKVFRFTVSRTKNREEALDITQEVFIDLWKALKSFRYKSDKQFYGFVFLIARRKVSKYWKHKKDMVEFNENYITENYEIEFEDYRRLSQWINKLKPKYQELLRLRYWAQLTFAEIAASLQIKESTAKVWHHRALKQLQKISNYASA